MHLKEEGAEDARGCLKMSSAPPVATKTLAECPKNNNKDGFDRFMAFCTSRDAHQLKLSLKSLAD